MNNSHFFVFFYGNRIYKKNYDNVIKSATAVFLKLKFRRNTSVYNNAKCENHVCDIIIYILLYNSSLCQILHIDNIFEHSYIFFFILYFNINKNYKLLLEFICKMSN